MSAKNTYMKFDYMRLSHMRVKWNEIRYIPICYQFFAGWEDLVLIIHIRTLRNVKIVVQERVFVLEDLVPICVNSTHLEKIILVLHRRYINSYRQKQKKIRKGNDQERGQSERNSHSINRGVGKTKMTLKYLYHENMS